MSITRTRELTFRAANAALIGAVDWLHRRFDIRTTYRLGPDGAAALFEDCWFAYHPREFGCTGNIDYAPQAENATRHALFERVRDGQVFYDVGAHGGVYTITLRRRFPGLIVHAFEPQPEDLLRNMRLNAMPTDTVHPIAVGETPGSVRMTTGHRSSNHVSESGARTVPMARIDDYARENSLPPPDWIKIDIEGLELPALKGAEQVIAQGRPTIICEINHLFARFGSTIPEFLGHMRARGYEVHALRDGALKPLPDADSFEGLGHSADNNFWFVPAA